MASENPQASLGELVRHLRTAFAGEPLLLGVIDQLADGAGLTLALLELMRDYCDDLPEEEIDERSGGPAAVKEALHCLHELYKARADERREAHRQARDFYQKDLTAGTEASQRFLQELRDPRFIALCAAAARQPPVTIRRLPAELRLTAETLTDLLLSLREVFHDWVRGRQEPGPRL